MTTNFERLRPAVISAFAVMAVLTARTARAEQDPAFHIGSRPAWLLLGGVTTGGTVALGDRGALVGGELSLVRLRNANFVGLYGDGYYDWGANGTWVTGGLELGRRLTSLTQYGLPVGLGLDGGIAVRLAEDDREIGATVRLTSGFGVVGIYVRYAHFWDTPNDGNVIQVGLLLKMPIWAGGSR